MLKRLAWSYVNLGIPTLALFAVYAIACKSFLGSIVDVPVESARLLANGGFWAWIITPLLLLIGSIARVIWGKLKTVTISDWFEAVELFGYALPRKVRERVFTPYYEELKADYLETRRLRTPWKRRILAFCFTVRTLTMVVECVRVVVTDRVLQLVFAFMTGRMQ